jgi:hypothetical protein
VRYEPNFDGTAFAGSLAFRVDRASRIVEAGKVPHPAPNPFGDLSFERAVVAGGRLLLLSQAGVLSTQLSAPGPGQFLAYEG